MTIRLDAETVISLSEAARVLPRLRRGRKVHTSTLYRWASRGLKGVVLETLQVGGTTCTSREACSGSRRPSAFRRLDAFGRTPRQSRTPYGNLTRQESDGQTNRHPLDSPDLEPLDGLHEGLARLRPLLHVQEQRRYGRDPIEVTRTKTWADPIRWNREAEAANKKFLVFTCS